MGSKRVYSERTKKIFRITILGSVTNALLVVLKLFVGIFGHSSAMIAEAINSISDFATDLIALIFIRISVSPETRITTMVMGSMRRWLRSSWLV